MPPTVAVPLGSSVQSALASIEPTETDVCCISAIPPFAFSNAKTLSRELRAKFPRVKVVIVVWGFSRDIEPALVGFRPSPPDKFVRTLSEALECLGAGLPADTTLAGSQARVPSDECETVPA